MSGPLKYDYSKLKGDPADAPGLTVYLATNFLPVAGGTMAGDLDMDGYNVLSAGGLSADTVDATAIDATTSLTLNSAPVATQAYSSNASNLSSGTVSDARLSSNVPRLNAANTGTLNVSGRTTVGSLASPTSELPIFQSGADRANFSNGTLVVTTFLGLCASNPAAPDVFFRRNATGPTAETRAAGGARICNADGSALAALACSMVDYGPITAPASPSSGVRVNAGASADLYFRSSYSNCFLQMGGSGTFLATPGGLNMSVSGNGGVYLGRNYNSDNTRIFAKIVDANTLSLRNSADSADVSLNLANLTASGYIDAALRSYTVAGLPLASANTRKEYWVTDSTLAMTSANYGSTVSGGGSNGARVISNGTNWVIA